VLGALSSTERAQYERHLGGCAECRDEVAALAVLPGLLGRLDAGTAASLGEPSATPAPPQLLDSVLRAAGTERGRSRRRRRWQLAGAGLAAACLALLVGLGVSVFGDRPARVPNPVVAQMQPVRAGEPLVALLGYAPAGSGTDIQMLCLYTTSSPYAQAWTVRLMVYPRGGGSPVDLKSWPVEPGEDAAPFDAHTALAPGQIDRIELVRADGERLLVYQPT
jgi:hypothetical protein